ncbi:MAG: anti-sigma factor [Spirulinaceae cyanobacterium]
MNDTPEFDNLEELLAGYVLGDLDEAECTWLKQQLANNPELLEQIEQLQETLALVPYGLPSQTPSPELRELILATAQRQQFSSKAGFSFTLQGWGWLVAAFATLGAICLGIDDYYLRQQLAFNQEKLQQQKELITLLRQPNNSLVALRGINRLQGASGSLFIVPEQQKAVLTLQNLDSLPGNQVYRLWAVSPNKKVGCINFKPDEEGTVHIELSPDSLTNAKSVLVTIENQPDTLQPQGISVMKSYQSL